MYFSARISQLHFLKKLENSYCWEIAFNSYQHATNQGFALDLIEAIFLTDHFIFKLICLELYCSWLSDKTYSYSGILFFC